MFRLSFENGVKFHRLREKCPYLELFLSAFCCIRTEHGEIQENTDQNNSEYGHFSRNGGVLNFLQALFKYPLKSQNTIDCCPQKNLSFNQQQHRWYDALIGAVYFLYCENIGKCTPA